MRGPGDRLSRMAGSTKACVFCGRTGVKLTKEHAFPRWVSRALNTRGFGGVILHTQTELIRNAPELDIKIRAICKACNSGWLHDLEHAFRAVMLDPIRGLPLAVPMPVRAQRVVALWAVKTWLLVQHGWNTPKLDQPFPLQPEVLGELRQNNRPSPNAGVWIGAVNASPTGLVARTGAHPVVMSPRDEVIGIMGVYTVGSVLFAVYMPAVQTGAPPAKYVFRYWMGDALSPYLSQIWPNQVEEVGWPPSRVMSVDDIEYFWPSTSRIRVDPPLPA